MDLPLPCSFANESITRLKNIERVVGSRKKYSGEGTEYAGGIYFHVADKKIVAPMIRGIFYSVYLRACIVR